MRFIGENQKDHLDTRDGHLYAIQYGIDENGFGDVWFLENITYRGKWANMGGLNYIKRHCKLLDLVNCR